MPLGVSRVRRALRGREEDEQPQVFGDRVKAMLRRLGHEVERARCNRVVVAADAKPGPAAQTVVDLVLRVRLLLILVADGERVEPEAHRRHAQELAVALLLPELLGEKMLEIDGVCHASARRAAEILGMACSMSASETAPTLRRNQPSSSFMAKALKGTAAMPAALST